MEHKQRKKKSFINIKILFLYAAGLMAGSAQSLSFRFVDFDNTILESRQFYGGVFSTSYRLFLIEQPPSPLSLNMFNEAPKFIDVSSRDFQRVEKYLSTAKGIHGTIGKIFTLEDGKQIDPSQYVIRYPDTYWRFFDDPEGRTNYLLEDFQAAEALVNDAKNLTAPHGKKRKATFQGPFWNQFVEAMDNLETAQATIIITARGHDRYSTWREFFNYLQQKGYIKHTPHLDHIHGISRFEYSHLGYPHEIAKKKTEILKKHLKQISRMPLSVKDFQLSPDGSKQDFYHLIVLADDNQDVLQSYLKLAREYARSQISPIKFSLFNSGTHSEIRRWGPSTPLIVTSSGALRKVDEKEKRDSIKQKINNPSSCREVLTL